MYIQGGPNSWKLLCRPNRGLISCISCLVLYDNKTLQGSTQRRLSIEDVTILCFATRLASWGFKFLAPATKHGSRGSQKSTPATKNGTKSSPNSAPARKHGTGGPPNSAHIY